MIECNMGDIAPCVAGPKRPQDRVPLSHMPDTVASITPQHETNGQLKHGDVVILASPVVPIHLIQTC